MPGSAAFFAEAAHDAFAVDFFLVLLALIREFRTLGEQQIKQFGQFMRSCNNGFILVHSCGHPAVLGADDPFAAGRRDS
jgi:hypothetical protein